MTDSEEETSGSDNNWPMNEDWMINILKGDDKSDAKVKINVNINGFVVFSKARSPLFKSQFVKYMFDVSIL